MGVPAYSAETYTAGGYSPMPTQAEIDVIRAYNRDDLALSALEFWRPRNQPVATPKTEVPEVTVDPLPDPLEQFFLTTQGYDGKQVFLELKERYRATAFLGRAAYGRDRVIKKLGEMVSSVPLKTWRFQDMSQAVQAHVDAEAQKAFEYVEHEPRRAIQMADEISVSAGSVRPESIFLLQQVIASVSKDTSLSVEAKLDIREKTNELFALYSIGRVEPMPVGEKWQDAKGPRSVLIYQHNAVELSPEAKAVLALDTLLSF